MAEQLSQAEQAFDAAVELLDCGEGPKAEALLELVIGAARTGSNEGLLARALCVLGEWLHDEGRDDESRARLAAVLAIDAGGPGPMSYERGRARRLLERLQANSGGGRE